MAENNIANWLKQAREAGLSDEKIREQLKQTGWNDAQITGLIGPKSATATPITSALPQKKKVSKKLILISGAALIILLLIGGGVYAYTKGYLPIPFLSKDARAILLKSFSKLAEAKSGKSGLIVHITTEERSPKAKPLSVSDTESPAALQKKDSTTMSNATQLRTALILYSDDYDGQFPDSLEPLAPAYISKIPAQGSGTAFDYKVNADKKGYTISYTCLSDQDAGQKKLTSDGELESCTTNQSSSAWLGNIGEFFESVTQVIPADMQLEASITAFTSLKSSEPKKNSGIVTLAGTYKSSGTTYSMDIEARIKDGQTYVQVREIPSIPFFDYSSLLNKWIAIDQQSIEESSLVSIPDINVNTKSVEQYRTELPRLATTAFDQKLLIATVDGKETLNGHPTTRIRVNADLEKIKQFSDAYLADAKKRNIDTKVVESILKAFNNQSANSTMKELLANTTITFWVDQSSSNPRKFEINTVIVPPDTVEKLKNKQVRIITSLVFDNLGAEPDVDIPKDAISSDEAMRILSGQSVEEYNFRKQLTAVDDIRSALSNYHRNNDSYPTALDELLQKPSLPANSNSTAANPDDTYFYRPLKAIPNDIFTEKPFEYRVTASGYTLKYTITFPPEKSDEDDSYDSLAYYKKRYVEGINTADEKVLSQEAAAKLDSDNDGLTDAEEEQYGTKTYSADTDGDGFTDKQEVDRGHDPLVSSKTAATYGTYELGKKIDNTFFKQNTFKLADIKNDMSAALVHTSPHTSTDYVIMQIKNTATNKYENVSLQLAGPFGGDKDQYQTMQDFFKNLEAGSYRLIFTSKGTAVANLPFTLE